MLLVTSRHRRALRHRVDFHQDRSAGVAVAGDVDCVSARGEREGDGGIVAVGGQGEGAEGVVELLSLGGGAGVGLVVIR